MHHQVLNLWNDTNMARVETYILQDSPEFQNHQKKPAVIVCPGGAYLGTSDREAEPVALRFNAMGYHAVVLRYNTFYYHFTDVFGDLSTTPTNPNSKWPGPLHDLGKTMLLLREKAEEWCIDPDRIAVCGFSAGGNLAGNLATRWNDPELALMLGVSSEQLRPAAVILGYPVLDYFLMRDLCRAHPDETGARLFDSCNIASFGVTQPTDDMLAEISPIAAVSKETVPCFIWHTASDPLVFVENSLDFARKLSGYKIPFELHIFPEGPHGMALADETTVNEPDMLDPDVAGWIDLAKAWLHRMFR
jgi:acetyl esterase/lipase